MPASDRESPETVETVMLARALENAEKHFDKDVGLPVSQAPTSF